MASRTNLPPIPSVQGLDESLARYIRPIKGILDVLAGTGNANPLDKAVTFRNIENLYGKNIPGSGVTYGHIVRISGTIVRTGRIESNDSLAYFDLDQSQIVMNGKSTYDSAIAGLFLGLDSGTYKFNIGDSTHYFKFSGSNTSWKGTNAELTEAGVLSGSNCLFTGGTIGGWIMTSSLLKSASSGARIELNQSKNRISIFDAVNEKLAMGYLNGLAKYDGSGNWGASDYGFWALAGDSLQIDGDAEYVAGTWIVKNDGSYEIHDAFGNCIIRLGTDTGEKGLFTYNASGTNLGKFITDEIFIGTYPNHYLHYTVAGGLEIRGGILSDTLSAISADLGTVNAGTMTGVMIIGSTIQTATSGKRVIINSDGMILQVTASTGKYSTFKYGDGTKYGTGALAYIHHTSQNVPFYISAEQTVADFHFFPRSSVSSGAAEHGDTEVVDNQIILCLTEGTPGTFAVVGPNLCYFLARPTADQNDIAIDSAVTAAFATEIFDVGSDFASNTFTAPLNGIYHFDVSLHVEEIDIDANYYELRLVTSNRTYTHRIDPDIFDADGEYTFQLSVDADMDASDTAYVVLYQSGGAAQSDITTNSWFSGHAIYQEAA